MDFFTLQDNARKQTRFLVFLFIIAVIFIASTINLIFYLAINWQTTEPLSIKNWLSQPYWLYITAATLAVIGITSLFRSWQLNSTPDAVAKMVNATPVALNTTDPKEKRLVNIVEEMSIASGMPIPHIYVMQHEDGINAFVAGLNPSSVCLVVTSGLLNQLNRQELQGVIAHEFSHVFHGDMRINVRLIGVLAGILVIGQLGGLLLRTGGYSRIGRRNKSSGNAGAVIAIGVGLFAVGYIGLFFGRLIKAAISRQREFLADASAVQYTRDKEGISRALNKIAQHQQGSLLNSEKAEEMSHLCFGESVKLGFSSLLATHPPIQQRIKAINPEFQASANTTHGDQPSSKSGDNTGYSSFSRDAEGDLSDPIGASQLISDSTSYTSAATSQEINSDSVIASIGEVSPQQINSAHRLIESIPPALLSVVRGDENVNQCYDSVMALLDANQNNAAGAAQSANLKNADRREILADLPSAMSEDDYRQLTAELSQLDFSQQHCLLDLSLARIEQQPAKDNQDFVARLSRRVTADQQISQSEFMIYASAVKRALPRTKTAKAINRFNLISSEIIIFFNMLYQHSQLEHTQKQQLFNRQMKLFGIDNAKLIQPRHNIKILSQALAQIALLNHLLKRDFIQVCIETAQNDGIINQNEYELLRLLGAYLDTPLPLSPS